jgi:hypothetical protein
LGSGSATLASHFSQATAWIHPKELSAMRESISNVGFVCQHNAPKAGKYAADDPQTFVGKFVKMAFKAHNPVTGKPTVEHMWVKVTRTSQGKLLGKLDNDPVFVTDPYVQCGDSVSLTTDQIEDVTE